MRLPLTLLAVGALAVAGCISPENLTDTASTVDGKGITKVAERANLPFRTDDSFSHVLEEGAFGILPALSINVPVTVRLSQGLPTQNIHMGVFLPNIKGCDWSAAELAAECQVPVVADIGPYYGEGVLGDVHATEPANRLGKFLIDNLVPHGYAVAQVSVMGTGDSGGCMDLMGEVEQAGVQAAVEYLGTAAWSNGAVGLIGRSYDGSTPWEAAMVETPYLKTVVPISGLTGQHDLMWRNGSAESRGPGVLWGLYYAFTYTGNEANAPLQAQQIAENLVCPDTQTGAVHGLQAYATGDKGSAIGYWDERSFGDEVLENYKGSIYFIHGMQDWNVDPHMAFPFYNQLEAKGLEVKGLFGQWAHMYPDRPSEHSGCGDCTEAAGKTSVRWDWAQDLLEWFDHYLKGTGAKPELHVEMQDDAGRWRIEKTWPALDTEWADVPLPATTIMIAPGMDVIGNVAGMPPGYANLEMVFDEDIIIAGMTQLKLAVTPAGPGGQVYVELRDMDDGGRRLGHAIMDLRYAAGGTEMQPVVPGMKIIAQMEFEPMDAFVPAGHKLMLYIAPTGQDYLPSSTSGAVNVDLGASQLLLPIVKRGPEAFFTPPGA